MHWDCICRSSQTQNAIIWFERDESALERLELHLMTTFWTRDADALGVYLDVLVSKRDFETGLTGAPSSDRDS
jgi:hypothetical protein